MWSLAQFINCFGRPFINKETDEKKELNEKEVVLKIDFWFVAYFNNLGRISKSRAQADAPFLLAISSSFGFFARFFRVMFGHFVRGRNILSRPVSVAVLMGLMTVSFFILLFIDNHYLYISTAILGICSGVLDTIDGSVTSDLFGSKNSGMVHRIILTNIPLGVLLYGSLAALENDSEGDGSTCIGFKCFH